MYLDSAATTPLSPGVWDAMAAVKDTWGNSNSHHPVGKKAAQLIEQARADIAKKLGVDPLQLVFTHGGTDANRRVIWACRKRWGQGALFGSGVEHSSISDEILPGNTYDPWTLGGLRSSAKLACHMYANNETGILLDPSKIKEIAPDALILQDWVQGVGKAAFDPIAVDFATFSAHKFHGPKGLGLLYVKHPDQFLDLSKDTHTQNTMGIMGMAQAFDELSAANTAQLQTWTHALEEQILARIPDAKIHHRDQPRVPGITSVAFRGIRGSELMARLGEGEAICVSTGSACNQDLLSPSRIIQTFESDPAWQYPIRMGLHKMLKDGFVSDLVDMLAYYVEDMRA